MEEGDSKQPKCTWTERKTQERGEATKGEEKGDVALSVEKRKKTSWH